MLETQDSFEKSLLDFINSFDKQIADAEERILSDEQIIETAKEEKKPFEKMLHAYAQKKKRDSEAIAALFISERTDADLKTFCESAEVRLPVELEPAPDEEETHLAATGT